MGSAAVPLRLSDAERQRRRDRMVEVRAAQAKKRAARALERQEAVEAGYIPRSDAEVRAAAERVWAAREARQERIEPSPFPWVGMTNEAAAKQVFDEHMAEATAPPHFDVRRYLKLKKFYAKKRAGAGG